MRSRRESVTAGFEGLATELTVGCPACATPMYVAEDDASTACPRCGRSFFKAASGATCQTYLDPRIGAEEALHNVRTWLRTHGHRATRIGQGHWTLVPYWRFQAKAFKWFAARRQTLVSAESGAENAFRDLTVRVCDFTLRASALDTGLPSLGSRADLVTTWPLDEAAHDWAHVLPVDDPPNEGRVRALLKIDEWTQPPGVWVEHEKLTLIGEELSVIYFPFFVVPYQFRDQMLQVVVDGDTGGVTAHYERADSEQQVSTPAVPIDAIAGAAQAEAPEPEDLGTIALVPLRCPGCAGDLPEAPYERVRRCDVCRRAWEMQGRTLVEIAQQLVDNGIDPLTSRLLPFWALRVRAEGWRGAEVFNAGPVFVPAFESRHIERMCQLGIHLTQRHPQYGRWVGHEPRLSGCTVSSTDAKRMAWVMAGIMASADADTFARFLDRGRMEIDGMVLMWIPLRTVGLYLREPVTGALVREESTRPWPAPAAELAA